MSRSLSEMKIREILRLKESGLSNTQIAQSLTVQYARSTVVEVLKRSKQADITYASSQELSDQELEKVLYPRKYMGKRPKADLDEEHWARRIAETGKTCLAIWEDEYLPGNEKAMSYGGFSLRIKKWKDKNGSNLDYPKNRKAGEIMETDWCGDKPSLVYSQRQQKFIPVHIFVASIGFSQKVFAKAYPDEKQESWIDGHTKAFEYYQALPKVVVPDNTKTAVKSPHRYEPEINPVFMTWAEYYNVAIVPARVSKPKDKDRAENASNLVQQRILPNLKQQVFFDLDELNKELLREIEKLNHRQYQRRSGTRSSVFKSVDLPAMRPLPAHPFVHKEMKWVRVSKNNYHVLFHHHQYSAPFSLAGEKVLLVASNTTIELLYNNQRVALHGRSFSEKQYYVTDPKHMPQSHQEQQKADGMTGERYVRWAEKYGSNTAYIIGALLEQYAIEQQAYNACMGILRLANKYSPALLEAACKEAKEKHLNGYKTINFLIEQRAKQNIKPERRSQEHDNIRGSQYYAGGQQL